MATVADIEYWAAQLRAAIGQMGVQAQVTERHNNEDLVLIPSDAGMERSEQAHLINALEIRGFSVTSTTKADYLTVEASGDRLQHDFAEVSG